ncbi:MAG: autotransporter-associated beta strand repeat-containing protein, partial [Chlamydiia bacterium]|nr:autotransporter-associated beta strand repeat-containing protein [Chlamydiia bacterium]
MSCFKKIIPFFCVPVFLIAATGTWNVDASGNWETASNWTPGPPPDATTDIARFLAIITANRTVTINTPKIVQGTEFNNNFNYLISGSTLTYQNGAGVTLDVTGGTGQHSIASSVVLANNFTATITPAINFTISGPISGAGTLTKAGAGTLILSGTASNTFSGLTTVSAGGLTLSKSGGAVAIPGDL